MWKSGRYGFQNQKEWNLYQYKNLTCAETPFPFFTMKSPIPAQWKHTKTSINLNQFLNVIVNIQKCISNERSWNVAYKITVQNYISNKRSWKGTYKITVQNYDSYFSWSFNLILGKVNKIKVQNWPKKTTLKQAGV